MALTCATSTYSLKWSVIISCGGNIDANLALFWKGFGSMVLETGVISDSLAKLLDVQMPHPPPGQAPPLPPSPEPPKPLAASAPTPPTGKGNGCKTNGTP